MVSYGPLLDFQMFLNNIVLIFKAIIRGVPSWDETDESDNSYGSEDSGDNFEQYMTENVYVHDPNRV